MSALDLLGLNRIFKGSLEARPTRKILRFLGASVSVEDNPDLKCTDITIQGGTGEGNVSGPESTVPGNVTTWDSVDGKSLADSGVALADLATTDYVDEAIGAAHTETTNASYLTLFEEPSLPNERVLTAGGGHDVMDEGPGGSVTITHLFPSTTITADYTISAVDRGKVVRFNHATIAGTITIAKDILPQGSEIWILQENSAQVTIANATGVILRRPLGFATKTRSMSALVAIRNLVDPNIWNLTGDLEASTTFVTMTAESGLPVERILAAGAGMALTDGGPGGNATFARNIQTAVTNSTAYTLALTEAGKDILFQQPSVVVTIPLNASVAFPIGTEMWLIQGSGGTPQVTITAAGGVTLRVPTGRIAATRTLLSKVHLVKTNTDIWTLDGDLQDSTPYVTIGAVAGLEHERALAAVGGLGLVDGGAGAAVTLSRRIGFTQTGSTAYTLSSSDDGKLLAFSGTPVVVTIPDDTTPISVGTEIFLTQIVGGYASQVSFVAAGGVVLRVPAGKSAAIRSYYSVVRLFKQSANFWIIDGDLKDVVPYVTVGAVTGLENERALTAGAGMALTDGGADSTVTLAANIGLSTVSATSYTFVLTDAFKQVAFTNAAGLTATIPPNSSVPFPIGTRIWVQQNMATAAPSVTIAAGAGVSMSVPTGRAAATRTSQAVICLQKIAIDTWVLSGDLMDTSPYITIGNVSDMYGERALAAGLGMSIADSGGGGSVTLTPRKVVLNLASGGYINLANENTLHVLTGATTININIPSNATAALPIGYSIELLNNSSNSSAFLNIVPDASVTILGANNSPTAQLPWLQFVRLTKIAINTWIASDGIKVAA